MRKLNVLLLMVCGMCVGGCVGMDPETAYYIEHEHDQDQQPTQQQDQQAQDTSSDSNGGTQAALAGLSFIGGAAGSGSNNNYVATEAGIKAASTEEMQQITSQANTPEDKAVAAVATDTMNAAMDNQH